MYKLHFDNFLINEHDDDDDDDEDVAGTVGLRVPDQLMDHAPCRCRCYHAEDICRDSRRVPAAAPWMTKQVPAAAANGRPVCLTDTRAISPPVAVADPAHPPAIRQNRRRLGWSDFLISVIDFIRLRAVWPLSDCSLTVSAVVSYRRMWL